MSDLAYDDDGEGWRIPLQAILHQNPSICFDDLVKTISPLVPACVAARHWHGRHDDEFSTERQRLHLLLGDTLAELGAVAAPLDCYATEIQRRFHDLDAAEQEVVSQRVATGRALIAARAAVDAEFGPGQWEAWCQKHIRGRTQRDIRKLMRLAGAEDPEAAAAEEREAARARMARIREDRANVRPVEQRVHVPPPEVTPRSATPRLRLIEPEIEPPADVTLRVDLFLPEDLHAWATEAAEREGMSLADLGVELFKRARAAA